MVEQIAAARKECEVFLIVNGEGEYVATHDREMLAERFDAHIGRVPENSRTIQLTVSVPLPQTVGATAIIPDDAKSGDDITVTIKDAGSK